MILFWDTETQGLPKDHLPDDHQDQPQLVELGAILCDDEGRERASMDLIIAPDGWTVPAGAAAVHGITTEIAHAFGVPLAVALSPFFRLRQRARETVAYNEGFDQKIVRYAISRTGRQPLHPGPEIKTDLMQIVTPIVNLPPTERMLAAGYNKPKPPKLSESYRFFFTEELAGAHGAIHDARAASRIYFHPKREGKL